MMPQRIQRKRTKGWRMPESAVYVGRPSRWGNPFVVWKTFEGDWSVVEPGVAGDRSWNLYHRRPLAAARAVELYRTHIGPMGNYEMGPDELALLRAELRGRDLVCWCPLDEPCHADVLLEIANLEVA